MVDVRGAATTAGGWCRRGGRCLTLSMVVGAAALLAVHCGCGSSAGDAARARQLSLPKTDAELVQLYLKQAILVTTGRSDSADADEDLMDELAATIRRKGDAILSEFLTQYQMLPEDLKPGVLKPLYWPIVTPRAFEFITGEMDGLTDRSYMAATLLAHHKYAKARPRIRALYDQALRLYQTNIPPPPGHPWPSDDQLRRHDVAVEALSLLGTALMELGDVEPALRNVRRLMEDNGHVTTYSFIVQELRVGRKMRLCAGPVVERMLRLKPEERWWIAYQLSAGLGVPDLALLSDSDVARVVKWCQSPAGRTIRYESWVSLSREAYRYKDFDLALLCAGKALELVPGDVTARYIKALVLSRVGRHQEALRITEKLSAEDPPYGKAQFLRLSIQIDRGKLEAVQTELARLRTSHADSLHVLALSMKLASKQGKAEEARRLGERLAEHMRAAGRGDLGCDPMLLEAGDTMPTSGPAHR